MAHYLPVLLVSVTNNIAPDDSSLSTLPRGQVDYLSHEWREEDVWHSWRKMTRQKNEIANGLRLENASWRTWWKQRNKLKTVTPETLNWLKDSDVTWLYGPLHTAVEWTPPVKPKLKPEDAEVAPNRTNQPRHKPILKYRSICELLTSQLTSSPPTPPESDEEGRQLLVEAQDISNVSVPEEQGASSKIPKPKRAPLVHTKSDTHITRWGPICAFREDSPPRINPPCATSGGIATSQSKSSVDGYFSQSQVRSSYSQDSNSSTGTSTTGRRSSRASQKKKHISFNTFVEQCIAIEKPNNEDDTSTLWGARRWDYDDGYEEDEEDNNDEEEEVWDGRTRHHHLSGSAIAGSDSDSGDEDNGSDDADDDDDALEIRLRSSSHVKCTAKKQRAPRSPSTSASISTPSSRSTSASSPPRSISPSSSSRREQSIISSTLPGTRTPRRRSSTTSAYRPRPRLCPSSHYPSFRTRSRNGNEDNKHSVHVHVTIAPIAPTILKTTDSGYDGWAESFGDDGGSDDGLWGKCNEGDERDKGGALQDDETTPVELVYVPPQFTGRYSVGFGTGTEDEDINVAVKEGRIEDHNNDSPLHASLGLIAPKATNDSPFTKDPEIRRSDSSAASTVTPPSPIPTVVIESLPLPRQESRTSDVVEDVPGRLNEQEIQEGLSRQSLSPKDRRCVSRSRSRSYSRSRTPSPAVDIPPSDTSHIVAPVPVPVRRMSSSVSPPDVSSSSSLLCPPTQRGRSSSYQDLPRSQQRGRSNTRTPPSSSGESPMGSLSPDSSFVRVTSIVGGVYASGRTDRERQREKEKREDKEQYRDRGRDKDRGRDRAGRRPSQSWSPDLEMGIVMKGKFSTEGRSERFAPTTEETHAADAIVQSSTMVNSLEVAESSYIPYIEQDNGKAEEVQRKIHPTPSNSPVLTMKAPPAGLVAPEVDTTPQASQPQHLGPQTQAHYPNNAFPASTRHQQHSHTQSPVNLHSSTTNNPSNLSVRSPIKGKAPLLVPSPHPIEPSTSLSISPPGAIGSLPSASAPRPQSPRSPTAKESTIVEKAVGIVSSAGAFLGFWHS